MNAYEQARERVNATPELSQYAATILYDWPEGDVHWAWVTSASVDEIVAWATAIPHDYPTAAQIKDFQDDERSLDDGV